MICILSPAKRLDFPEEKSSGKFSQPELLEQSKLVVKKMRSFGPRKLKALMKLSDELAELNVQRFADWNPPFDADNAKQAILAFKGDVYLGMAAAELSPKDLDYAQDHLRILSGLHGILRPLDLIQAYRLEMGSKVNIGRKKDLYAFWNKDVTELLKRDLEAQENPVLINLASDEYFKSIDTKSLDCRIIKPIFKDKHKDSYKVLQFFAKKARGYMSRYVIDHRVDQADGLLAFDTEGYRFNKAMSEGDNWVFTRG